MALSQNELDTFEYKLKKRGFRRDDVLLHDCAECKQKAVLTYVIVGRTGGRDIQLCMECGKSRSWRSSGSMNERQEEASFDLATFLR